jgi:hypothetical protein
MQKIKSNIWYCNSKKKQHKKQQERYEVLVFSNVNKLQVILFRINLLLPSFPILPDSPSLFYYLKRRRRNN